MLECKRNLPTGVYVNEEYRAHMRKNRDILRPILKLAKSIPAYKDKSKLQGDKLVINGNYYSVNDLSHLPPDLAAYKAAQYTDNNLLVFRGELSPYSNFHSAPFVDDNQHYTTSEHFIQYQEAMFFGDTFTANAILNSSTPYKTKRLSYQINGIHPGEWKDNAHDICFKGIVRRNLTMHCSVTPFVIRQPICRPCLLERVYKPMRTPH